MAKIRFEAASRQANLLQPKGPAPEVDKGSGDIHKTKGLPEAGDVDNALDKEQQPLGGGAPATTIPGPPLKKPMSVDDLDLPRLPQRAAAQLERLASQVSRTLQDQALARRLNVIARTLKAYEVDDLTEVGDDLYSTGSLPLSGDESIDKSLPGGNDPPKNEVGSDQSGKIELWGTDAPTSDMLASKQASADQKFNVVFQYKADGRWATGMAEVLAPNKTVAKKRFACDSSTKGCRVKAIQLASKPETKVRKASKVLTPWSTLASEFSRIATQQNISNGSYSVKFETIGPKVAQLTASVRDLEGAEIPLGVVAFTLLGENATTKTATVEVNDALVANETLNGVTIPAKAARKYASKWAKAIRTVAEQI